MADSSSMDITNGENTQITSTNGVRLASVKVSNSSDYRDNTTDLGKSYMIYQSSENESSNRTNFIAPNHYKSSGDFSTVHNGLTSIDDPIFTGFTFYIDPLTSPLFLNVGNYSMDDYIDSSGKLRDQIETKLKEIYGKIKSEGLNDYFFNAMKINSGDNNINVGFGLGDLIFQDTTVSSNGGYGAIEYLYMVTKPIEGYTNNYSESGSFDFSPEPVPDSQIEQCRKYAKNAYIQAEGEAEAKAAEEEAKRKADAAHRAGSSESESGKGSSKSTNSSTGGAITSSGDTGDSTKSSDKGSNTIKQTNNAAQKAEDAALEQQNPIKNNTNDVVPVGGSPVTISVGAGNATEVPEDNFDVNKASYDELKQYSAYYEGLKNSANQDDQAEYKAYAAAYQNALINEESKQVLKQTLKVENTSSDDLGRQAANAEALAAEHKENLQKTKEEMANDGITQTTIDDARQSEINETSKALSDAHDKVEQTEANYEAAKTMNSIYMMGTTQPVINSSNPSLEGTSLESYEERNDTCALACAKALTEAQPGSNGIITKASYSKYSKEMDIIAASCAECQEYENKIANAAVLVKASLATYTKAKEVGQDTKEVGQTLANTNTEMNSIKAEYREHIDKSHGEILAADYDLMVHYEDVVDSDLTQALYEVYSSTYKEKYPNSTMADTIASWDVSSCENYMETTYKESVGKTVSSAFAEEDKIGTYKQAEESQKYKLQTINDKYDALSGGDSDSDSDDDDNDNNTNTSTPTGTVTQSVQSELSTQGASITVRNMLRFINGMKELTTEYPYIFQTVDGLDGAYSKYFDVKDSFLGSDDKIKITCLESVDMKVSGLFNRYANCAYDRLWKRERLPVNLRRFNCSIFVHDFRNFRSVLTNLGNSLNSQILQGNHQKIVEMGLNYLSAVEFKFFDCEIVPEETGNIFDSISNEELGDYKRTAFTFTYGNCIINFLPFGDMIEMLDMAKSSLLKNSTLYTANYPVTSSTGMTIISTLQSNSIAKPGDNIYGSDTVSSSSNDADIKGKNVYDSSSNDTSQIITGNEELDKDIKNSNVYGEDAPTPQAYMGLYQDMFYSTLNNYKTALQSMDMGNVYDEDFYSKLISSMPLLASEQSGQAISMLANYAARAASAGTGVPTSDVKEDFGLNVPGIGGNVYGNKTNFEKTVENLGNIYSTSTNEPTVKPISTNTLDADFYSAQLGQNQYAKNTTNYNTIVEPAVYTHGLGENIFDAENTSTLSTYDLGKVDMTDTQGAPVTTLGSVNMKAEQEDEVTDLGTVNLKGETADEVTDLGSVNLNDIKSDEVKELGTVDLSDTKTTEVKELGVVNVSDKKSKEVKELGVVNQSEKGEKEVSTLGNINVEGKPTKEVKDLGVVNVQDKTSDEVDNLGKVNQETELHKKVEDLGNVITTDK